MTPKGALHIQQLQVPHQSFQGISMHLFAIRLSCLIEDWVAGAYLPILLNFSCQSPSQLLCLNMSPQCAEFRLSASMDAAAPGKNHEVQPAEYCRLLQGRPSTTEKCASWISLARVAPTQQDAFCSCMQLTIAVVTSSAGKAE